VVPEAFGGNWATTTPDNRTRKVLGKRYIFWSEEKKPLQREEKAPKHDEKRRSVEH
jgi:hypothetical protein